MFKHLPRKVYSKKETRLYPLVTQIRSNKILKLRKNLQTFLQSYQKTSLIKPLKINLIINNNSMKNSRIISHHMFLKQITSCKMRCLEHRYPSISISISFISHLLNVERLRMKDQNILRRNLEDQEILLILLNLHPMTETHQ